MKSPLGWLIFALLMVTLGGIAGTRRQSPVKPATAAQAPGPVVVLAITNCGQLLGYVAAYASGKALALPPMPGTVTATIEVTGQCGVQL